MNLWTRLWLLHHSIGWAEVLPPRAKDLEAWRLKGLTQSPDAFRFVPHALDEEYVKECVTLAQSWYLWN